MNINQLYYPPPPLPEFTLRDEVICEQNTANNYRPLTI